MLDWLRKLFSIFTAIFANAELVRQNQRLEAENASLKADAELAKQMQHRPPYWYKGDDQNPLCPRCWQRDHKPVYMGMQEPWGGGLRRTCAVCEWRNYDKPMEPAMASGDLGRVRITRRWPIFPDELP